jgi:hypothetical protein
MFYPLSLGMRHRFSCCFLAVRFSLLLFRIVKLLCKVKKIPRSSAYILRKEAEGSREYVNVDLGPDS